MQSIRSAVLNGLCGVAALGGLAAMPAAAVDLNFDYKVNQGDVGTTFATLSIDSFAPNTTTFSLDTELSGGNGNPGIVELYFGCNGCGTPDLVPGGSGVTIGAGGTQAGYAFDYRVQFDPSLTEGSAPIIWTANSAPTTFLEATSGAGPDAFALIQLTGGMEVINGQNIESGFYVAAVPEPSTYAMLLAGLGLVGFMYRRRQQ